MAAEVNRVYVNVLSVKAHWNGFDPFLLQSERKHDVAVDLCGASQSHGQDERIICPGRWRLKTGYTA